MIRILPNRDQGVCSHISITGVGMGMSVGWSRLKYLNNYRVDGLEEAEAFMVHRG